MKSEDDFEALLAATIERFTSDGSRALDEACAAWPEHSKRLRENFARLQRAGLLDSEASAPIPTNVGRYEILGRLGRGGMGVVYLARDPRDSRRVALKVGPTSLEPGDRISARFEREVRAFAALEHENLVRVLDVGDDQGRPFFTMEYVAGATLGQVLDALRVSGDGLAARDLARLKAIVRENAARLDTESVARREANASARATLASSASSTEKSATVVDGFGRTWIEFVCRALHDVARALAYVHAHGIVHRDVKPANILVREDGRVLLFDLGLARVETEEGLTKSGEFAGTPHYVSPEQARGRLREIDARTDIFALGVTLYELLTLRRPFDGDGSAEILSAITDREPIGLRRIDPLLPRDLETICATALEKDPARRYATMADFADDLRRFLEFQPVLARPISRVERTLRFARRRPALSTSIALGALIAVGLPTGLFVANRAISSERDRAELAAAEAQRQARTSARVIESLVEMFHLPSQSADDVSAKEILDRGARRAESDFADQPLVRAALLEATGRVYQNLGASAKALQLFDRSLALRQRELGESHPDTARTVHAVGTVHLANGEFESARALFERALAALAGTGATHEADEATFRTSLGDALVALQDPARAVGEFARAAELLRKIDGPESASLARVLERRGRAELALRDAHAAARSLDETLALLRRSWAPDLGARSRVLDALADAREILGEHELALRLRAEAADLRRKPLDESRDPANPKLPKWHDADSARLLSAFAPPWRTAFDLDFQAGITALQAGRHANAVEAFERCLVLRPRDPICAYNIACAHGLAGEIDAGLEWLSKAADFGFGRSTEYLATALKDADLEHVRQDPRAAAILERMRADTRRADPAPSVFVPSGVAPAKGWPVLVVLHREGANAVDVARGPWREIAQALSCVLLVPSAHWPLGADASAGSTWVDGIDDFVRRPWSYEEPVVDAVRAFGDSHAIDRERIVLVGEGRGALVAFDLAARAPGLFGAVLLVDGPLQPALAVENAPPAAVAGLRVSIVLARGRGDELAELHRVFLTHCGFGERARVVLDDDASSGVRREVEALLRPH